MKKLALVMVLTMQHPVQMIRGAEEDYRKAYPEASESRVQRHVFTVIHWVKTQYRLWNGQVVETTDFNELEALVMSGGEIESATVRCPELYDGFKKRCVGFLEEEE